MTLPSIEEDPDSERQALRYAKLRFSVKRLMDAATKENCDFGVHPDTVLRFVTGRSTSIRPAFREQLSKFFASPGGAKILGVGYSDRQSFDKLVAYLSAGNRAPISRKGIEGTYLEYHGSYLEEDCYAIRLVEIVKIGPILSVTDQIKETRSGLKKFHPAHGCAVVMGEPPRLNIITFAEEDDNRIGLSLFTGSILNFDEKTSKLLTAEGNITGLTRAGFPFRRGSHLVRIGDIVRPSEKQSEISRRIVDQETGVFKKQDLKKGHQREFDLLSQRMKGIRELRELFSDPCLKESPKRD
jgi:hypothetical protein